jgi:hypothetical protein
MHDQHVLQINQAKGMLESVIADLEAQALKAFKDQDFRTRTHVLVRLKVVQEELAELVTVAGSISIEPIPQNPNTAWEVAQGLVGLAAHSSGG